MENTQLVQKVEALIRDLSLSITCKELQDGWTPAAREAALKFFKELLHDFETEGLLPAMSISRALDH